MKGLSSSSAGVLFIEKVWKDDYIVLDVIRGESISQDEARFLYSAAQDWEEIEGDTDEELVRITTEKYWLAQTLSYLRSAIFGLESTLEKEIFEYVEYNIATRLCYPDVINNLLIAPLKDSKASQRLAETALSHGYSVVAAIFDELSELQPPLRRLTDHWLNLQESEFHGFGEPKSEIWLKAIEVCRMKDLLRANDRHGFLTSWDLLAFYYETSQSRSGICRIGIELAASLFPSKTLRKIASADTAYTNIDPQFSEKREQLANSHEVFEKVQRQISAILEAVSQGYDSRAKKYLRELIQNQLSFEGGLNFAVKSLCNIAQRCADMFRNDFEYICLENACELDPSDAWTLVQYGNYLKRIGKYDEAIEVFKDAEQSGESTIAKSSTADVFSQQGQYLRAIEMYKAIPEYSGNIEVLTAIADNHRKMGKFETAEKIYFELIESVRMGLNECEQYPIRAYIGLAEISKKRGTLDNSIIKYKNILKRDNIKEQDRLFCKLGLCNVLKLMENYEEAYQIIDEVIQQFPFYMEAKYIRGSILGLIGEESKGLADLPEIDESRSWRDWLRFYYRGLLQFKLERYDDAKKNLVEELPKSLASSEDKAIHRMAAALWFLRDDKTIKAQHILSLIPEQNDYHAEYLSLVLRLHCATLSEDQTKIQSIVELISQMRVKDKSLGMAVIALKNRDFQSAFRLETNALIRLAA